MWSDAIQTRIQERVICSDKINPKNLASRTTRQERSINDYRSFPPMAFRSNAKREPTFPRFHQFFIRVLRPGRRAFESPRTTLENVIFASEARNNRLVWLVDFPSSKGNEKGTSISPSLLISNGLVRFNTIPHEYDSQVTNRVVSRGPLIGTSKKKKISFNASALGKEPASLCIPLPFSGRA